MPTRIANLVIFPRGNLNNNKPHSPTISPPFCPVSPSSGRFPLPSRPAPSPPISPQRLASLPFPSPTSPSFPSFPSPYPSPYSSQSPSPSSSTPALRSPQLRRVDSAPALILVINPTGRSSSLPQNDGERTPQNKNKKSTWGSRNMSSASLPQLGRRSTRNQTTRPRPSASTPLIPKISLSSSSSWHERLCKPFIPNKPHIPSSKSCKHRLQRCLCPFCGTSASAQYCVICQDITCAECADSGWKNKSKSQNCLVQEFPPPEVDRYHSKQKSPAAAAAKNKLNHCSTYSENELIQNWIEAEMGYEPTKDTCSHTNIQAHRCLWCAKPNANYCVSCQFIWCQSCGGRFGSENKITEIDVQKDTRSKVSKVWKEMIKGVKECMI